MVFGQKGLMAGVGLQARRTLRSAHYTIVLSRLGTCLMLAVPSRAGETRTVLLPEVDTLRQSSRTRPGSSLSKKGCALLAYPRRAQ